MTNTFAIPAMANVHSHAFQRDLRGIAERAAPAVHARDDFWSWRTAMFAAADRLDVDSMRDVARRVYGEMRAAGYGMVGEFHYVHHRPDGTPYKNPNALAHAVAAGAADAGLKLVLIPAAYNRNGWDGVDRPPANGQRRFCDPTVEAFLRRVDELRAWADARHPEVHVAIAAHSVRAVPARWLEVIAAYAETHGLPRHVHAHEQRRELSECRAEHGCSPIALLKKTGYLGPTTSVIHGVHVDPEDVQALAESNSIVVSCPTTEGNLGDGYLPAMTYRDAGVRLAIGSDSQVRVDPFEEIRELETGARRERQLRAGLLATARDGDLWSELTANGRASLGLTADDPPTIHVDLDHPQLAGISPEDRARAIATCASAAVVTRQAPRA
jgi:formimidoylglutamate deiminase